MAASMHLMSVRDTTDESATLREVIMTLPSPHMGQQEWATFDVKEKVLTSSEELKDPENQVSYTFSEDNTHDANQTGSTFSDTSVQNERVPAILSRDETQDVLRAVKSQDFGDLLRSTPHLRTFADLVTANLVEIKNGRLTLSTIVKEELEPKLSVRQGRRAVEQSWIDEHPQILQAFTGEWIVVEGTEIVSHGAELGPLIKAVRAQGIKQPYVIFVEPTPPNVTRIGL